MSSSLSHIRVLDLSRVLAGPWCGQILADLGADVVKVERPGAGDDTRTWGPPWIRSETGEDTGEAAYFMAANRGKKSVTIDISIPEGQALVRSLADRSDVLLENYKVGGLRQYGLDYESLSASNPRLIYCSITGFGQDGPYSSRAGYDFIVQGMGGLMSITGERDDLPGGGPQKVGVAVADLFTGMYATVSVLAALAHRDVSGRGQYIDMALLDTQVAMTANMGMNYLASGKAPVRAGNAHSNIVPYQTFAAADGEIILAVGNDGQFARLCRVAGRPDLAEDERFATNPARVKHRSVLVPILAQLIASQPKQWWSDSLEAAGVPCGAVNDLAQVFADPHVRHRRMQVEMPHPTAGHVSLVGSPIKMSETPVSYASAPPLLGQHTDEVLRDLLGLDADAIAGLRERHIV
ncbi:MAG: CaiB/BaiF CoA-transferase family protein [Betaproteobacteria bacterium]|jgi:formyl-CoA transferase